MYIYITKNNTIKNTMDYIISFFFKQDNKYEKQDNIIKKIKKWNISKKNKISFFDNYSDELTSIKENHKVFDNFKNYYKNLKNNDKLLMLIMNRNYETYENVNFCRYCFLDNGLNTINQKKFRDFIEDPFTKMINSYNLKNANDKIRLIKSYDIFDNEKLFSNKELELCKVFIKKKNDLDILFYEECLLENHLKILQSEIYKSYKIRDFFENQNDDYWKNKKFEKHDIRDIAENHISFDIEHEGYIRDEYRTERSIDVNNTCGLLKDYIDHCNNMEKNNNAVKLKYIEKYIEKHTNHLRSLGVKNNKICTILIDDE